MSAPLWSYFAFAAILFVATFCQESGEGNFTVTLTIEKFLVYDRDNWWKLWCSEYAPYGSTCQETGRRGLTTGHDALAQLTSTAREAMETIETCYAFCMEQVSVLIKLCITFHIICSIFLLAPSQHSSPQLLSDQTLTPLVLQTFLPTAALKHLM